nr:hypothetical protein [Tanacetum cinerariifolium]GEX68496.1 hypothetical protein [Tanacetum cinerariifolium]
MDEMFERVRAFIRGEVAAGLAEMNLNKLCDYYGIEAKIQTIVIGEEIHRGSRSLMKVILHGKTYPPKQSEKWEPRKGRCEGYPRGHCVTLGSMLLTGCKHQLVNVPKKSMDVFAWACSEGTAVPQFVMKHQLKAYPLAEPMIYKKRPLTLERRMIEKVLADQKGWNVEVYLEDIVVRSKNEQSLIQDVEETLGKLQRHRYAESSLMDMAYRMSESVSSNVFI